jgi:hypothetical protein
LSTSRQSNLSGRSVGAKADGPAWVLGLVTLLVTAVALTGPLLIWNGGLLEIETTYFIPQYLDHRSIAQKVFDPDGNDLGNYTARELGYAIDLIDAHVFDRLLAHDVVALMSLSTVVATVATVAIFLWGLPAVAPRIDLPLRVLMVMVYATNFVFISTAGMYYRSAKPMLVPALLAALVYLHRSLARRLANAAEGARFSLAAVAATAACGSVMSLLDRPGFYYTLIMFAGLLAVWWRRRVGADLVAGAFLAIAVTTLYNLVAAPALIRAINGYSPSFDYQRVPLRTLAAMPVTFLARGTELTFDTMRIFAGSFPHWTYVAALVLALAMHRRWISVAALSRNRFGIAVVAFVLGAQVVMTSLMILRHPPIFEYPDHRLVYYPLPVQPILLLGMALAADRLLRHGVAGRRTIAIALAALIAGNVLHWRGHRDVALAAPWFPIVYGQSTALKSSLRDRVPSPELDEEYRNFYDFAVTRLPPRQRERRRRNFFH